MSLRELTAEKHKDAERQAFVKELLGGSITEERYATFLYNLHPIYNVLEMFAMANGLLADISEIRRAPRIHTDYQELWKKTEPPKLCPTVSKYILIAGPWLSFSVSVTPTFCTASSAALIAISLFILAER